MYDIKKIPPNFLIFWAVWSHNKMKIWVSRPYYGHTPEHSAAIFCPILNKNDRDTPKTIICQIRPYMTIDG